MAKIDVMPAQDVIDSFRGVLDFYSWCNLNIVRKWPRYVGGPTTHNGLLGVAQFAYINRQASLLPANIISAYTELASDTAFTFKDWMNALYISGTKYIYEP